MASSREINRELTERLYNLLRIKRSESREDELERYIQTTKASMTKEEIAWVEQQLQ